MKFKWRNSMKKIICIFMILSICLTSFGCSSVKKKIGEAVVTNVVNNHPEQISAFIKQVSKMLLTRVELTQDQLGKLVIFLSNCKELCKNPAEYTLTQAQELIDNLNDPQIQIFAVQLMNMIHVYIETEDSTNIGNRLAVLACDAAIEVINEKIGN